MKTQEEIDARYPPWLREKDINKAKIDKIKNYK